MKAITSYINRFNIVRQIPIFSRLNWFDIQKIASKADIVEYQKGDNIVKEGSAPDFFYCLVSGRIQAYTLGSNKNKENVDFIHRGMSFGLISSLTGKNHSMSFEALNDSLILRIPKQDFKQVLKSVPSLAMDFGEILSKRVRRNLKENKAVFESQIISVYSPTRNTGSTTYAVHLALSLKKETNKKVIFVQIRSDNKNKESNKVLNWQNKPVNLYDIIKDYEHRKDSIITNEDGIDTLNVIFSSKNKDDNNENKKQTINIPFLTLLESSNIDLPLRKQIAPFVSALVGEYHYVIVDLPNEEDDLVLETLAQSDLIHLVESIKSSSWKPLRNMLDRLELILKDQFKEERVKVLLHPVSINNNNSLKELKQHIDYEVYAFLPFIKSDEKNMVYYGKSFSFLRCDKNSDYKKKIRQIAREVGDVLVGLVLGGGAALGMAHIGVLKALEKENINIDVVAGSSMGALIGSLWVMGRSANEIELLGRQFEKKAKLLGLLDFVFPVSGIIGGKAIKRWLKQYLGNKTFDDVNIPIKIISYDLMSRKEIVIEKGSLVEAVRQSISIPGIIEPIKNNKQVIIDGGVMNPLPTEVLAAQKVKKLIAVNVLQSPRDVEEGQKKLEQKEEEQKRIPFFKAPITFLSVRIGGFFSKMLRPNITDIITLTLQASEYVISVQSGKKADVYIHPDLSDIHWFELYRVKDLVNRGQEAALKNMKEIKKLVES